MDTKAEHDSGMLDTLKIALAIAILLSGIVAYYYYTDASQLLRVVGVLMGAVVSAWVALQSDRGRAFAKFVQSSRVELRKVVWPTREETMQTTLIVLVFASIMGTFFFLLDLFLRWFTVLFTGQGG